MTEPNTTPDVRAAWDLLAKAGRVDRLPFRSNHAFFSEKVECVILTREDVARVAASLTTAAPAVPAEGTHKALEFAEYMAKGAEQLLQALEAEDAAHISLNESDDEAEFEELDRRHTDAISTRCEFATGLRSDIYEFRKRASRGAPQPEPRREPKGRTEGLDVYFKGREVFSAAGPGVWKMLAEFAERQSPQPEPPSAEPTPEAIVRMVWEDLEICAGESRSQGDWESRELSTETIEALMRWKDKSCK